jgi:cytochrome d ubiquinol oxidase subunit I
MDALFLSRLQFAFTVSYHYMFTTVSIGLGLFLVITEGLYLKTGKIIYFHITRFWFKVFAIVFTVGIATGIVLEFQFGTNWANYAKFVGDVFGSLLLAEGLFAFFIESVFLAIALFGWKRVSKRIHFFSTIMVSLGSHMSAVWIVAANSWQQTPAGHVINNNRAELVEFFQVFLNPSSLERIWHVICGAWQAGAFFTLSISAFYILRKRHLDFARISFRIALWIAVFSSILQLVSGHSSMVGVSVHQPVKFAALEGHFGKNEPAPVYVFGWVSEKEKKVRFGLKIPGLASFLLYGDAQRSVRGLDEFPAKNHPPLNPVFQFYHLMVALGMGLIFLSILGLFLFFRGKLFENSMIMKVFLISFLGPQIANQMGWFTAEVGRQPYIVQNILRTAEGLSSNLSLDYVLFSLAAFVIIYFFLFLLFLKILLRQIGNGPALNEKTDFS